MQVPWRHKRWPVAVATPRFVRRAHRAGVHVHVWTGSADSRWVAIDDAESLGTLLDMGVDGVITDRTDVLKDVLIGRGQWRQT
jgi:glycerophosphoryl diester phosphodiesterase